MAHTLVVSILEYLVSNTYVIGVRIDFFTILSLMALNLLIIVIKKTDFWVLKLLIIKDIFLFD